jgi:Zn-dependent protease
VTSNTGGLLAASRRGSPCPGCGSDLGPGLLSCPSCHRLVHAETLAQLAREAEQARTAGDASLELSLWRRVLELLPPQAEQSRKVGARVVELSRYAETAPTPEPPRPHWARAAGAVGVVGLLLWKMKFLVVFALTKLKFLALGFTKMSTVLSMMLSVGVYWTVWGWRFALGVVIAIYVHEMGHVAALRRYGIAATAPMFIPGLGALVRLKQSTQSAREDARVGLAGPLWGLGATLFTYGASLASGLPLLAAIARFSAWINLFNLLPVWQLDGGRAFATLTRGQRWIVAAVCGLSLLVTQEWLLAFLGLAAAARAWQGDAPAEPDTPILIQFAGLVVALAFLTTIPVKIPGVP